MNKIKAFKEKYPFLWLVCNISYLYIAMEFFFFIYKITLHTPHENLGAFLGMSLFYPPLIKWVFDGYKEEKISAKTVDENELKEDALENTKLDFMFMTGKHK